MWVSVLLRAKELNNQLTILRRNLTLKLGGFSPRILITVN